MDQNTTPWPLRARSAAWAGIAATMLIVAACGGSADEPVAETPPPPPPPTAAALGDPVTQTIGVAGGAIEATTFGSKLRITFPAGALAADTQVKITPTQPAAGDSLSVRLEPGNVFFAQPVAVVVEFAAGATPDRLALLRQALDGSQSYLATSVDTSSRTVATTLNTFGGAAVAPLAAAPTELKRALRVRVADDPPPDAGGTLSVEQRVDIARQVTEARANIADLRARGAFIAAMIAQQNIAALLQRSGEDGYTALAQPFLADAHDIACSELATAIATSKTVELKAWGDYLAPSRRVIYWQSVAMRLDGTPCQGPDPAAAVQALIQRELDLVKAGWRGASTPTQFDGPAGDVKGARQIKAEAAALHNTNPAAPPLPQSLASARPAGAHRAAASTGLDLSIYVTTIQQELIEPALLPARNSAWNVAKETGALAQYKPLIEGFGPVASLLQDVQYQRTAATLVSADDTGYVLNRVEAGTVGSPDLPVEPVKAVAMAMRGGTLAIGGNIAALQCPTSASETLSVTFDGTEVASLPSAGDKLLANGSPLPAFTAAGLLAAAGLPANDAAKHLLRVRRTGSACATAFGIADDVLITAELDFGAAPPPLQKFENCYFVVGNVLPADGQRVDTWQIARNGNGTAGLTPRNLDSSFRLDNIIYPVFPWPSEAPRLSKTRVDYYGRPYILDLAFSVDAQNRRHLDGTIQIDPLYEPGSTPSTVSATCRFDLP